MNPRLNELFTRWLAARREGTPIAAEELCRDCPELLPNLNEHIALFESATREPDISDFAATTPGSTVPPEIEPSRSGIDVPGYQVLGELGRGGMGVVYMARQLRPNRVVALKMILSGVHAGAGHRTRFLAEAEAIARLRHPNIVQIHDVGQCEGQPYFSLEYCDGGTLVRKLSGKPLPVNDAAELVQTLARGVSAVYSFSDKIELSHRQTRNRH